MDELARQVWRAVRPVTAQQRFLHWCGTLLLASGLVHGVIAVVDGAPWLGAVSWRKPVVFGLSFGILAWSAVWVLRQLPARRWGWLPAGLLGVASLVEVGLITMQRWRGVPSHFNEDTPFDEGVFGLMGNSVMLVALAIVILLVWSLAQFRGTATNRVAVVAGLLALLVAGAVGSSMISEGEAVVAATGEVPDGVVFGAAGSAKLAHAAGMHGLQVLGLLAIVLEIRRVSARLRIMLLATAGYAAVFASVTVTAYAGRSWIAPTVPMALLAAAGLLALMATAALTLRPQSENATPAAVGHDVPA